MKSKSYPFLISLLVLASIFVACGSGSQNKSLESDSSEYVPADMYNEIEEQGDDRQPEKVPSHINFSGLYYDANNKQAFYIYWDTQRGEATSVYFSDAQDNWKKAAIQSQEPSNFFEYQEAEQKVEITFQNRAITLFLNKESDGAKGVTKFVSSAQLEGAVILANASEVPITESLPVSAHIAEALAAIKWEVRDPNTWIGSKTATVNSKLESNRVIFTRAEGGTKTTFTCEVLKDYSIRCATEGYEDFSINVEIFFGTGWQLNFDVPTGEGLMTLIGPRLN